MRDEPLSSTRIVVADVTLAVEIVPGQSPGGDFGLAVFAPLDVVVQVASSIRRYAARRRGREPLEVRVSSAGRTLWERSYEGRTAADAAVDRIERVLSERGLAGLASLP